MIDARVDDAVKQHLQKMDWLHGEGEDSQTKTSTPPSAAATASDGKLGITLPPSEPPQAQEVIGPILEKDAKPEGESVQMTPSESVVTEEPAASTASEGKMEKESKTEASPPKDGTPVWLEGSFSGAAWIKTMNHAAPLIH